MILFVRLGMTRNTLVFDRQQLIRVVDRTVSVVAHGAIENVMAEDPIKRRSLGDTASSDVVRADSPSDTVVAQARARRPLISTMHVSHVSMGPSCG
jgi:hypothetical protein